MAAFSLDGKLVIVVMTPYQPNEKEKSRNFKKLDMLSVFELLVTIAFTGPSLGRLRPVTRSFAGTLATMATC